MDIGFILFGLKLSPAILQSIIKFDENEKSLEKALTHLGFTQSTSRIMSEHPQNFLWPSILKFFKGKTETIVNEITLLLSRIEVLKDPEDLLDKLFN